MSNYNHQYSFPQQQQQGYWGNGYNNYNYQQQYVYGNNQMYNQNYGNNAPQIRNNPNQSFSQGYGYQNNQSYNNGYNNYGRGNYSSQSPQFDEYNNFKGFKNDGNRNKNQLNASVSYKPIEHSFDNSFASEAGWNGMAEVGRFGGKKKKNRQELDTSSISNSQSKKSTEPKIKQPTVKQESSNQFYFPVHTETTTFVQCPFNSEHIMEPDRLMTHINKCKLKSPNAKHFSVCPYDPCHYFSTKEIEAHILVCDKRSFFVVEEVDPSTILNTSTTSSAPQSSENELLEKSNKNPSSKLVNQEKSLFEDHIIHQV